MALPASRTHADDPARAHAPSVDEAVLPRGTALLAGLAEEFLAGGF